MDLKKHKTLFILGGIFVLLLLCFLGLSTYNRQQAKKDAERDDTVQITDSGDLTDLQFTDSSSGTQFHFVKEDGTWYVDSDREIPLNQSYLISMEDTYSSLTATREITDPDSLSDYGLASPAYTVQTTDSDGNVTSFSIGNAADEDYYLTVNGQESPVYTVSSTAVSVFQYDLDTLVQKDTMPSIGSGNLLTAEITENGQTTTYSSDNDDDSETLATIAGGYGAMTLDTLASYHASGEELNQFGLDEGSRTLVKLTYTESSSDTDEDTKKDSQDEEENLTYTISIGASTDDGNRYVQVQDSSLVYLVTQEKINNLLGIGNSEESEES